MSLNLLVGFAGLVSFGHSAYVGVGAYVVGILAWHQYEETKFLGLPGTGGIHLYPIRHDGFGDSGAWNWCSMSQN